MLEGIAGSLEPGLALRLVAVLEDLDVTVRQIRTLIFRLQLPGAGRTLRSPRAQARRHQRARLQPHGRDRASAGRPPDLRWPDLG
jgi:hypothetical protein